MAEWQQALGPAPSQRAGGSNGALKIFWRLFREVVDKGRDAIKSTHSKLGRHQARFQATLVGLGAFLPDFNEQVSSLREKNSLSKKPVVSYFCCE